MNRPRFGPLRQISQVALLVALMIASLGFLTDGLSPPAPSPVPVNRVRSTPAIPETDAVRSESGAEAAVEPQGEGEYSELWQQLETEWRSHLETMEVTAASAADWLTVCRRLSLALVGTGVSLEEIRSLERLPESQRVSRHRDRLLASDRFADYWGERMTRMLVGADNGPFLVYRRRKFRNWLTDQLAENVRYDDLIRRLVTAEGLWTDRPEVNFYTVTYDSGDGKPDPIRMAARTTRAFLGIRIDCLQCHDDFLGNVSLGDPAWMGGNGELRGGTQQDFHSLAAFFTAVKASGLQGLRDGPAKYEVQYLNADAAAPVQPQVPFRRDLLAALPPTNRNARERLAAWLTHPENKQTARAAVVRFWTLLFGRAPTDAVDDLPLDRPSPPLIDTLADAFIADGYNLRHLIQWITDMSAFRVDSRAEFEVTARHELALAVFPVTRLRSEQVAGAALQSSRIETVNRDSSFITQFQFYSQKNDFLKRFGDLGEDEFRDEPTTLTQRLTMLNGKLIDDVTNYNPVLSATAHIGMFAPDDVSAVQSLYLSVLNRPPTDAERDHFAARLDEAKRREHAIEDLTWVLFNSSEFGWNH